MYPIFCSPKAARKRSCRLAAGSALTAGNMEAASSVSGQGYAVMQVNSLIKMGRMGKMAFICDKKKRMLEV